MTSSGNCFEEMAAIQLAVCSWPGQAQLNAEDSGFNDGEVPEIFYLENRQIYSRSSGCKWQRKIPLAKVTSGITMGKPSDIGGLEG